MVSRAFKKHWNGSCSKKNGLKMSLAKPGVYGVTYWHCRRQQQILAERISVSIACIKHVRALK